MNEITLRELVLKARELADEQRIPFARTPWTPLSPIVWRDDGLMVPIEIDGAQFEYFVEPFVIVEQFEAMLDDPDHDALVDRVIQYAENDA